VFIDFGCYAVPLVILELYFFANRKAGSSGKFAMAGSLVAITLLMRVGIFGFYTFTQPLLEAVK